MGAKDPAATAPEAAPEPLDLRGLLCPLTWTKTRAALQRLPAGRAIAVRVDHRPAVPDLRRNTEALGHEVVSTREITAGVWELVLRKGEP